MNDKELRKAVTDELDFEPTTDAKHIGVTAENRVITLTGHVSSYVDKINAIDAAKRVRGVRGVADEIEVRFPGEKKTADDEIAKRAISIIAWDTMVPPGAVKVVVHDGWITLSGEVDWGFEKQAAAADVGKLSGVTGVINNIKIRPRVDPGDVKKTIKAALHRRTDEEARGINVVVRNGSEVTLEGEVDNWDERRAAERAAWSTAGVTEVHDRLKIA